MRAAALHCDDRDAFFFVCVHACCYFRVVMCVYLCIRDKSRGTRADSAWRESTPMRLHGIGLGISVNTCMVATGSVQILSTLARNVVTMGSAGPIHTATER